MAKAAKPKKRALTAKLNVRQQLFVRNLLLGMSGGRAAQQAGYDAKDPYVCANGLLRNPKIRAARDEGLRALRCSPEEVVRELELVAFSNIKDCWVDDGFGKQKLLLPPELPDVITRALKKFKAHPASGVEIEMYGKMEALQVLAKHFKLFAERDGESPQININVLVADQEAQRVLSRLSTRLITDSTNGKNGNGNGNH